MALLHLLAGTLALSTISALPSPSKKLSPRELAGIPLTNKVMPVRRVYPQKDVTPVGAPFRHLANVDAIAEPSRAPPIGIGLAKAAARQIEYITDVTIGAKNYSLIIDTGSSDTWVANEGFKCLDPNALLETPLALCRLGPLFTGGFQGGQIEDQLFAIQYGDQFGPFLTGLMGYSNITVAGVHIPKQQIALATRGVWRGDEITSGILGLGLPALTEAYTTDGDVLEYDPIVVTMTDHGVEPIFALGLSRDDSESFLSLGGVPDVKTGPYATTPIVKAASGIYARYTVQPERFEANNTAHKQYSDRPPSVIIDSGTTLNLLPMGMASQINALYEPPAVFIDYLGGYFVRCNATPPIFGVQLGGQMFVTDPEHMILPEVKDPESGLCATGVGGVSSAPYILGDTFMQGLVTVFDIGEKMEVRIAKRL